MKSKIEKPSQSSPNIRPKRVLTGMVAICFTGTLLGTIPLFKGVLIESFCCSSIALFRVTIAFISALIFITFKYILRGKKKLLLIQKGDLWSFVGYGAISVAAVNYFYLKSLTCTSTTIAVVTVFVAAPFTTLVATFFTGKKSSVVEIFYVLIIVIGCILVNMQTTASIIRWDGIVYAILAGMCYGLYSIFGKNLAEKYDYQVMIFWQFLIATVATFISLIILGGDISETILSLQSVSFAEIMAIAAIGIVSTFIPYLLYSKGLKKGVPPATASALTLLEPISGTILAFLFFNERISLVQSLGITIVVLSSWMLAHNNSQIKYSKKETIFNKIAESY